MGSRIRGLKGSTPLPHGGHHARKWSLEAILMVDEAPRVTF